MTTIIIATVAASAVASGLVGALAWLDKRAARRRRRALAAWYEREFDR